MTEKTGESMHCGKHLLTHHYVTFTPVLLDMYCGDGCSAVSTADMSAHVLTGPVAKRNDTDDARARVLDSEELIQYLQHRAQEAVDSREDAEEHQRHVRPQPIAACPADA